MAIKITVLLFTRPFYCSYIWGSGVRPNYTHDAMDKTRGYTITYIHKQIDDQITNNDCQHIMHLRDGCVCLEWYFR